MLRRRKIIWVLAIFALILAVLLPLRFGPSVGIERHLAEARAAGLPVTPIELDKWHKFVPPEQNAALAVNAALRELVMAPANTDLATGNFHLAAGIDLSPAHLAMLEQHLSNNLPALERFWDLQLAAPARYPVDLTAAMNLQVAYLADIKAGAQLLRLDAVYGAYTGDLERATRAIFAGFAVADTLASEPLLISQLVRYACSAIMEGTLEIVLSRVALSDAQLIRLSEALRTVEAGAEQSLYRALVGERVIGLTAFSMTAAQIAALNAMPGAAPAGGGSSFEDVLKSFAFSLQQVVGLRQRDKRLYLELLGRFIEATEKPYPERTKALEDAETYFTQQFASRWTMFASLTRLLLPSMAKAGEKDALRAAGLRCARTALAVERFRGKHGKLPASASELAPEFLAEIPGDPFGGALELKRLPGRGYYIEAPAASEHFKAAPRTNRPPGLVFLVWR